MRRFQRIGSALLAFMLSLSSAWGVVAQSSIASPVGSPIASPVASPVAAGLGIDIAGMDRSVDPGADFYRFANGGWMAETVIPPDEVSWGATNELSEIVVAQQFALLDALIAENALEPGSDQWKAVELYKQGIDMETRNAQGITPLQPQLDTIDGISSLEDMHSLFVSEEGIGIPEFFNVVALADPADSSVNTGWMAGPYLGLEDVTYYTENSESNQAVREAYKATAAQFFQLLGLSEIDAATAAQAVYDFEATLAANMVTAVEAQDFAVIYNPTTLDEMQALYPALDWQAYMTNVGATVDGSSVIIDSELRLMQKLATILETTDLQTIKHYMTLQVMLDAANFLSQEVRDIYFGLQQALYGLEEQLPVEDYALATVDSIMPDALGQLYVADNFSPQDKADVEALVANLIAAFRVRLQSNTWMSEETKAAALEKLDAMKVKVGYPVLWKTYETYTIGDAYWSSVKDSLIADYRDQMSEYGQPVAKDEWALGAQHINAGYDPLNNDIIFPAAILQAPFYDADADPASNYGAIGAVIGHEITHGFDLSGSQFDKDGNFVDWWTDADRAAFEALNAEAVAQYSAIEAIPGTFVDGQLTVTENVADMGGLQIAWDALQIELKQSGDPGEIDGYTQAQRFFIAFAQAWRALLRDEYVASLIQSNEHAPDFVRGVVPAQNMDAFYEAFPAIEPGDREYIAPEDRLVIW